MADDNQLPPAHGGRPFRAVVVRHNWRGGSNLCIGAEGYSDESFVVLSCSAEQRRLFPPGTQFELTVIESTRGAVCPECDGEGDVWGSGDERFRRKACRPCNGTGRLRDPT